MDESDDKADDQAADGSSAAYAETTFYGLRPAYISIRRRMPSLKKETPAL
jgi:hypothetical protein